MELSCHRHAGRRLAVLGMFSVADLVVGMALLALHQVVRAGPLSLVLLAVGWLAWVGFLRGAARRGLDAHLARAIVAPRCWRSRPSRP